MNPQKPEWLEAPSHSGAGAQILESAAHLLGMTQYDLINTAEHLEALSAMRDRLRTELASLDKLILGLQFDVAHTEKQLARFELGQQLGATKLARLLGCSRNHAIKHLETTFAADVHTRPNGSRWVARSVVEEWLLGQERGAA